MKHIKVDAAAWNSANPNLYQMPWTSDQQNRFFSLTPAGGGKEVTFTARYLGRPGNVAFKNKHNLSGKKDPCLCLGFPGDKEEVFRLVHPDNFVLLQPFNGYEPIEEKVIKQAKKMANLKSGAWYKKVWSFYCKAVEPLEYKQPLIPAQVARAIPTALMAVLKGGEQFSDSSKEDEEEGEKKSGDESSDVDDKHPRYIVSGGGSVPTFPDLDKQAPRPNELSLAVTSLDQCKVLVKKRLVKLAIERKTQEKQQIKQDELDAENRKKKENGEVVESDDEDASLCSEATDVTVASDFDEQVDVKAKEMLKQFKELKGNNVNTTPPKGLNRSTSTSSVSSNEGMFEL